MLQHAEHLDSGMVNFLCGLASARLVCDTRLMSTPPTHRYKHYRLPAEIASPGVWLSCRFCRSDRDVEELLCACGIVVPYGAIRKWGRKCGQAYAKQLRHRRPQPVGINGAWMQCFSRFMGSGMISGGPWLKMAIFSTSCAAPSSQGCGQDMLPQAPQGLGRRPASDGERSAQKL